METPAGMSTVTVRSLRDPSLAAADLAGLDDDWPSPAQVGHGDTETNWPNMLRAARRTSPLPPQVEQVVGLRARLGAAAAEQLEQRSRVLSLTVFLTPVATSWQR